jgi:geranylgeranyl diphosphate synthase, type I
VIPTQHVPEVLRRARDLVSPALADAAGRLSPELRPILSYHLGWTDASGRPEGANGNGGKGVRSALAVLSAEAAGAEAARGVPGAVAVELVHNFSLVHDDVIDEDEERRHRPTVWAVFGIGRAVIAGDALLSLAQEVVLRAAGSPTDVVRAARCLAGATSAMIAGQALDMAFETLDGVTVDRCLAMEAGKTGALLGCAASIGAILGGAPDETVEALDDYGVELGLAFQAVDDLLGIWGDPSTTGKPAWSDLRQRKKTLPVTAALAAGDGNAGELNALLLAEHLEELDIARAAALVEECGGRDMAREEARARLARALGALERAGIEEGASRDLADVARFVVERNF